MMARQDSARKQRNQRHDEVIMTPGKKDEMRRDADRKENQLMEDMTELQDDDSSMLESNADESVLQKRPSNTMQL